MSLPNGMLLQEGKYKIARFINSGGFGCTYEATQIATGTRVAIKELFVKELSSRDEQTLIINPHTSNQIGLLSKIQRKFLEEAKVLMKMSHPNIVKVYDQFEENGTAYYVMDYIDGLSLHEILKTKGSLPVDKAMHYLRQVADALAYVHARNRLHLDIKPSNILIDSSDNAILIDFGLSKQYDLDNGGHTTTLFGTTPGYSPIEQLGRSVQQLSPATDIYAFGATFYKCLSGETPPVASVILESGVPQLPHEVPANVRQAIEWAMSPRKNDRPQNIAELESVLLPPTLSPKVNDEATDPTISRQLKWLLKANFKAFGAYLLGKELSTQQEEPNTPAQIENIPLTNTPAAETESYNVEEEQQQAIEQQEEEVRKQEELRREQENQRKIEAEAKRKAELEISKNNDAEAQALVHRADQLFENRDFEEACQLYIRANKLSSGRGNSGAARFENLANQLSEDPDAPAYKNARARAARIRASRK